MPRTMSWIKSNGNRILGGAVFAFLLFAVLWMALVPPDWTSTDSRTGTVTIHVFRSYDLVGRPLFCILTVSPLIALLAGVL